MFVLNMNCPFSVGSATRLVPLLLCLTSQISLYHIKFLKVFIYILLVIVGQRCIELEVCSPWVLVYSVTDCWLQTLFFSYGCDLSGNSRGSSSLKYFDLSCLPREEHPREHPDRPRCGAHWEGGVHGEYKHPRFLIWLKRKKACYLI